MAACLLMVLYLVVGVVLELYNRKPLTTRQGDYLFLATGLFSLAFVARLLIADGNHGSGPRSSIELDTQYDLASRVRGHRAAA